MDEDRLTPVQPIPTFPAMYSDAVGELVPIPTFPSTTRPLLAEDGRVEKAYDVPMPTDPNTPRVVPGADPPTPSLINELFQYRELLPEIVEDPVQKVTWPEDPPVNEETESASQMTLPDESVVNLPPLDWRVQSYPLNWTAEETIKLFPIPTLPDKSDNPLTLSPDIK